MLKLSRNVICVLVFLLFSGLGAYWTHLGQVLQFRDQRFFMSELVNSQASAIERRLSTSISATRILAHEVLQNHGVVDNFDSYAESVLQSVGGISNLQLAPDGIVRYVYPLEGNEGVIGHNILRDDLRRKEALLAVETRQLTIAGPFETVQGGIAVIARYPIYLPAEQFWGFASVFIFLDDLLKVTELDMLETRGYSYQLQRLHPDTGATEVFARSASFLRADNYSVTVQVPGSSWRLFMSRSEPVRLWRTAIGYITSILAGFLAAFIAYYLLQQPEKLRQTVIGKTRELAHQANHDALTGLANRRFFSAQLDRVVREYARYGQPAILLYMDLDDFKRINDSMGHIAGDHLLQQIAARLKAAVRDTDIVARLGGDEFGILLLGSESTSDVNKIAEKIIATVEQPVELGSKSFVVSTSIGITLIPTENQENATILKNADLAMYSAKNTGKRKFCFYSQSLKDAAMKKQILDEDLGVAVEKKQFVLHYQPIVSLSAGSAGELNSYEALIRWQHPRKGLLYPDEFIGAAEDSGKIIDIGYWVIEEVCQQIKRAESEHLPVRLFSVNLSPKQFNDPQLIEKITHIILSSNIDVRMLELEVTESCLVSDIDAAIDMLKKLKHLGLKIALDDFGTGYSSLSLLKRLPVDRLKIDRSFVHDLAVDSDDQNIVEGLIWMAHKLQLHVVAEGIETEDQQQLLQGYQCDFGQGYLFSKPRPMDQLKKF